LEKSEFLDQLKTQLASIIPIPPERLGKIQQYKSSLFTVLIRSTNNLNEKNSKSILDELNVFIKNGDITLISQFNATKFIDYFYGLQVGSKYI